MTRHIYASAEKTHESLFSTLLINYIEQIIDKCNGKQHVVFWMSYYPRCERREFPNYRQSILIHSQYMWTKNSWLGTATSSATKANNEIHSVFALLVIFTPQDTVQCVCTNQGDQQSCDLCISACQHCRGFWVDRQIDRDIIEGQNFGVFT